ncbi:MAG: HTH-type transcriptional regulator, sugar sensing transcriptional regulator [Thermoplasmata archaeon]|nr:HTH-type transcriptional regulator, sugar sensing transcriptional regulator [Thermoplasmata archaeon]
MDPEHTEELKGFGLTGYEATAYATLLRLGSADASTVAHKAGIPFGRVYDVLNSLVDRGLLALHEGRPKQYRAVQPRAAMALLLAQRKRELDERYAELTRIASDLEKKLSPKVKKDPSSFYSASVGEEESRSFLVEKLAEASVSMDVNLELPDYKAQDADLFDALVAAVERGVRTRILLRESDVPVILDSPLNEVIARRMLPHLGKGLHVRVFVGEMVPFAVVDGEKAIVGVKNPVDPKAYFATVFIWDPKFAGELAQRFESLWGEADLDVGELVGKEP